MCIRDRHLTTPEPLDLQRHFAHAVAAGIPYLTMEVSSQALKYHRTLCTRFAAACFLNIGLDHISPIEHPDFEDYFSSKLRIFAQAEVGCGNLDCEHAGRVLAAAQAGSRQVITFSQKDPEADIYASQVPMCIRDSPGPLAAGQAALCPGERPAGPGHRLCGRERDPGGCHRSEVLRRRCGLLRPGPHVRPGLCPPVPVILLSLIHIC